MSKYKYEMYVSTGYQGSERTKVIDLVDDWGYDESDLDGRTKGDIIAELEDCSLDDFVWNSVDSGVRWIGE